MTTTGLALRSAKVSRFPNAPNDRATRSAGAFFRKQERNDHATALWHAGREIPADHPGGAAGP
ncbi:hypothetical protein FAGKG844_120109 [Frankia sp. AgKG'84/4]